MGGLRFTWGLLTKLWGRTSYPCDVAVKVALDDKEAIREYYLRGGDPSENEEGTSQSEDEDGPLPPLKYGTINSPLPEDWSMATYTTMGNFFSGNVRGLIDLTSLQCTNSFFLQMSRVSAEANFFPAALPCEGLMDLVTLDARIPRGLALKCIVASMDGSHYAMDSVQVTLHQFLIALSLTPCFLIDQI